MGIIIVCGVVVVIDLITMLAALKVASREDDRNGWG